MFCFREIPYGSIGSRPLRIAIGCALPILVDPSIAVENDSVSITAVRWAQPRKAFNWCRRCNRVNSDIAIAHVDEWGNWNKRSDAGIYNCVRNSVVSAKIRMQISACEIAARIHDRG